MCGHITQELKRLLLATMHALGVQACITLTHILSVCVLSKINSTTDYIVLCEPVVSME